MAWSPAGLNPVLWFDLSVASTVTTDYDGRVLSLENLGSGESVLTPDSAEESPFYKTRNDGMMPQLFFDGTGCLPFNGAMFVGKPVTVVCAFYSSNLDNDENNYLFGGQESVALHNMHLGIHKNGYIRFAYWADDIDVEPASTYESATKTHNTLLVVSAMKGPNNHMMRALNLEATMTTYSELQSYAGAAIGRFLTRYFLGGLHEIMIFDRELTEDEYMRAEVYLGEKWGGLTGIKNNNPYLVQRPDGWYESTPTAQVAKVSGVVQIDGTPAKRTVRAFGYNPTVHDIDGESVNLSKSLGHATSDPDTGEYTIDLLAGYDQRIFVVAFDDYGDGFSPNMAVGVGDRVHPTTPNGYVWECTGSGTLPSEEPAWVIDTETAQLYGTASMIAVPFYRPMVHGPVTPQVIEPEPDPEP